MLQLLVFVWFDFKLVFGTTCINILSIIRGLRGQVDSVSDSQSTGLSLLWFDPRSGQIVRSIMRESLPADLRKVDGLPVYLMAPRGLSGVRGFVHL